MATESGADCKGAWEDSCKEFNLHWMRVRKVKDQTLSLLAIPKRFM